MKDEHLSKGFEAGNYASAYITTDLVRALFDARADTRSAEFNAAFVFGFYSSYSRKDMSDEDRAALDAVPEKFANRIRTLGYVD